MNDENTPKEKEVKRRFQQRDVQSGSVGTEQTKSPISAITEDGDYRLRQVFQVRADRRSDLRRMRKPV